MIINKFFIITQGIMAAIGMLGIACAENESSDRLQKKWTGIYAGVNEGFVFNQVKLGSQQLGFTNPTETCNSQVDYSSYFPGVQLGYLHQFRYSLVLGIEGNVTFNRIQKKRLDCSCSTNTEVTDSFFLKNNMQSLIKGRIGPALNWIKHPLFPYLALGASMAKVGLTYTNEGDDYYSKNINQTGALIGAGLELAFSNNMSVRLEYDYVDYGNRFTMKIPSVYGLVDINGNARADLNSKSIAIAVNYWI